MLPAYKIEYENTYYKKKSFLDKLKEILKNRNVFQKLLGAALILLSIASFILSVNEDATGALVLFLLGAGRLIVD
ncbi:hypothetical protein [Kineothrix sedimenti]|uniref:Uncharacterized protein n=1 Tax=Kineothrix sedimenti TaxID=3123317 RepID=A0ABZ3F024_9FIRM